MRQNIMCRLWIVAELKLFISLLRIQKPTRILEIGSAIGYSAIRIAEALPEASIVTIERDTERYLKAVEYIARSGLERTDCNY